MSMPRKAMQTLGFQACCLRCDAPDDAGLARCSSCIAHHRSIREVLAAAPTDDPLYQLAKELMAMAAAPHHYSHDDVHGAALNEQRRLAAGLVDEVAPMDDVDLAAMYEKQRQTSKRNVLQDVGNQNPWKDRPLLAEDAKTVAQNTWKLEGEAVDEHYGARTIPSQPIQQTDRSERPGEDTKLTDRVHAAASTSGMDEEAAEIFETLEFQERQAKRTALKEALQDVKELVDDDLEF